MTGGMSASAVSSRASNWSQWAQFRTGFQRKRCHRFSAKVVAKMLL